MKKHRQFLEAELTQREREALTKRAKHDGRTVKWIVTAMLRKYLTQGLDKHMSNN